MDDIRDIAAMYDRDADNEHARLERHQLEYDLTWRYLERYLPTHGAVLEIGAATGRYTLELTRWGYPVTTVDLSEVQLKRCRLQLASAELEKQVHLVVGDARSLEAVPVREFDAVLLMGPLYHLVLEADRKLALQTAFDRLRANGVIFSALIIRLGIMGNLMKNDPAWIEKQADVYHDDPMLSHIPW